MVLANPNHLSCSVGSRYRLLSSLSFWTPSPSPSTLCWQPDSRTCSVYQPATPRQSKAVHKLQTRTHTCTHMYTHKHAFSYAQTFTHTHILLLRRTYKYAHTHIYTFTHTFTHNTYKHARTHKRTYTQTHMHAHTHAHNHHLARAAGSTTSPLSKLALLVSLLIASPGLWYAVRSASTTATLLSALGTWTQGALLVWTVIVNRHMCERDICLWVVHPVNTQRHSCSLLWARGHKVRCLYEQSLWTVICVSVTFACGWCTLWTHNGTPALCSGHVDTRCVACMNSHCGPSYVWAWHLFVGGAPCKSTTAILLSALGTWTQVKYDEIWGCIHDGIWGYINTHSNTCTFTHVRTHAIAHTYINLHTSTCTWTHVRMHAIAHT